MAGVPADYNDKYSVLKEIVKVVPNKGCVDFEVQNYSIKHRLPTVTNGQNTFAQNTDSDYFYYDYSSVMCPLSSPAGMLQLLTALAHASTPGLEKTTWLCCLWAVQLIIIIIFSLQRKKN